MIASVVLTIIISAICMALWLYEISYVIKWPSTGWLRTFHYSPFFLAFLLAISFLFPIWIKNKDNLEWKVYLSSLFTFTVLNCGFYILGWVLHFFSLRLFYLSLASSYYELISISGFTLIWGGGVYLGCLSYKILGKRLGIIDLDAKEFLTFFFLVFSVMPISILSVLIYVFYDDFIYWYTLPADAIKMGYPIFWIGVVLGVFSTFHTFYYSPRKRTSKE
jgi:hypothetical protein